MKYRIYGRFTGAGATAKQRQFCAMDLNAGVQVSRTIYGTLLSKEEADKFMEKEAPRNGDWEFEVRPAIRRAPKNKS